MDLFGMGGAEVLLVLIVALVVLGPSKVVEFAGTLGKMVRNLKKVTSELTTAVTREMNIEEERGHLPPGINSADKTGDSPDSGQAETDSAETPRPED